jgi:hypothetical protein
MVDRSSKLEKACLGTLLVFGIAVSLFGLIAVPGFPYIQLDRVLSRDELRDESKKEATLALLKRAQGNQAIACTGAGVFIVACSALGLYAQHITNAPNKSLHPTAATSSVMESQSGGG